MAARGLKGTASTHLEFGRLLEGTSSRKVARVVRLTGTETEDLWRPQRAPVVTVSVDPAYGFPASRGNVTVRYAIDPGDLTVRSRAAHVSVNGAPATSIPITVALSGVLVIPRPAGDAVITVEATTEAGHGAGHAFYDGREALSSLSISASEVPQRGLQGRQDIFRIDMGWSGDPVTAASMTVGGGYGRMSIADLLAQVYRNTGALTRTGNAWRTHHQLAPIARGASFQSVPVDLSVTGVNASNVAATLTARANLSVPALPG